MKMKKVLVVCTTDSMIWNFLVPHIEYLKSKGVQVECACSKTGFYFDELVSKGLILHEIPFERTPFKLKNISGFFKLRKLIKDNKYDLIQCHEPVGGAMGRLAGKSLRKKTMYFSHGFHFFKGAPIKHWLLYFTFEYILGYFTDSLITICKEDFENSQKLPINKRYLIPGIGIDFTKYDNLDQPHNRYLLQKDLGIPANSLTLISVGELIPRKNHIIILEALGILNDKSIHLIHCGEGELQDKLKQYVDKYNLTSQVHFLGFRRDIPKILCAGDVFVFPSLWEGLGLAGIEAMYMGLPVIGANRQGIKDYVIKDKTGFLINPTESKDLVEILKVIKENPKQLLQYTSNCRITSNHYSISNSVKALEEIYKKEHLL